jgi:DNA-binding NarL/FixJ family response regulator
VSANSVPVRVILLTAAIEKRQIVEALQLGARGVVRKDLITQVLLKAIQTVMAGEYWVDRESFSNLEYDVPCRTGGCGRRFSIVAYDES